MAHKITSRDIEIDFREALLKVFYGVPRMNRRTEVETHRVHAPARYNYQRSQNDYLGKHELFYKGHKFAELQCKPHKVVALFEQFDELRYPSKILERTILNYIPGAKVEQRYGE